MQPHVVRADIEQLGHFALRQPSSFVFRPQLDLAFAVCGGVEHQGGHGIVFKCGAGFV
jgi:hypothetical protein